MLAKQNTQSIDSLNDRDCMKLIKETIPLGVLETDRDGRITFVNQHYAHMHACETQEVKGKYFWSFVNSESEKSITKAYVKKIISDQPRPETFRIREKTKDDRLIDVQIDWNYIRNSKRKLSGLFLILTDITERKKVEHRLIEKNMALKELLHHIELEKKSIKDHTVSNIENLILPIVDKLKQSASTIERTYIDLLEQNLKNITSSFGSSLEQKLSKLTPREMEICNMIKNGLSSKEIAHLNNLSLLTIETHRNNIRKKVGITNKHVNLSTYLKSL